MVLWRWERRGGRRHPGLAQPSGQWHCSFKGHRASAPEGWGGGVSGERGSEKEWARRGCRSGFSEGWHLLAGGGWGAAPPIPGGHTEDTTHKDGASQGKGAQSAKKGWGPRGGVDDRTPTRGGGREEGAGAQLGGGRCGTYTEVIPTWPAPSPLSQPHGMVHTEKQKEENKYKSQEGE